MYAAVRRSGDPETVLAEATRFLEGEDPEDPPKPPKTSDSAASAPAQDELRGVLALWAEDYLAAADSFLRAASQSDGAPELHGFWLSMRALALTLAQRNLGDHAAGSSAHAAMAEALSGGAVNTFFSRLRASQARAASTEAMDGGASGDAIFARWDALLDRRRGVELSATAPRSSRISTGAVTTV